MYIINNEVSFNEEDGHLENSAAEVSVLMATSTRRLLDVLISNQGNPVERDCLLKTVWDDNGLRSSNSNLNQYISILRKQLAQVGLPDNTVITLPRV
ncbi:transcriptional regulator, partial [Salmonella enterica subsp. enterica serovar Goverdhan]|nr:transcriptional regulator [Salmonella enterica subsp. enterica serovar Goverdhan]